MVFISTRHNILWKITQRNKLNMQYNTYIIMCNIVYLKHCPSASFGCCGQLCFSIIHHSSSARPWTTMQSSGSTISWVVLIIYALSICTLAHTNYYDTKYDGRLNNIDTRLSRLSQIIVKSTFPCKPLAKDDILLLYYFCRLQPFRYTRHVRPTRHICGCWVGPIYTNTCETCIWHTSSRRVQYN